MKHTDRFSWQILTLTYQHINKVLYSNIWTDRLLCKIFHTETPITFSITLKLPQFWVFCMLSFILFLDFQNMSASSHGFGYPHPFLCHVGSSCCLMIAVSLELHFSSHRPAFVLQLSPRHNGKVSSLSQETTSEMCHQMRQNVKYFLSKQLANFQPWSLLTNQSDLGVPLCFFWTDGF